MLNFVNIGDENVYVATIANEDRLPNIFMCSLIDSRFLAHREQEEKELESVE